MRKYRLLVPMLALLASVLVIASPAFAASTLIVDDDLVECPLAGYTTIQAAVTAAAAGDTIEVCDGTYIENVTVAKDLTIRSVNGRAVTTIQGISSVGALGTVVVQGTTAAVTLGGAGQGFTILGIDNGFPGVENAAVYFRGTHSNAQVLDNEIVANGDHGLLSEYGATISGFVIDGNEFSGQTFLGANPAGNGFGSQFTLPNVPRQLVTMGGGSGGGNTSNTTVTNNVVSGTAGGLNGSGQEQGNTLATVDSNGATISGNTFAGTTSRFATQLRTRGPATTISGNNFDSTGIEYPLRAAGHVYVQNTGELISQVAAANTFNKGVWVEGAVGIIGWNIEAFVEAVPGVFPAGSTVNVLPGSYVEGPQIVAAANLTLAGADQATTIVTPGGNTGSSGDPRGWFLVNPGVNMDVGDLTFDGAGFNVYQAFRHKGTGTFDTVAFRNITHPGYSGVAIAAFGGVGPVDVTNSTFDNVGRIGVLYFGAGSTGTFSDNTYTGKGDGDFLDYAVEVGAGADADILDNVISDNRGVASTDGSTSAGILVTTFFGAGTVATITDNAITDSTTGVYVGFDSSDSSVAMLTGNTLADNGTGIRVIQATAGSYANRNAITGNGAGVVNSDAEGDVFDATCNWWGSGFGPSGFGPGVGDSVSDFVTFMPWLTSSDLAGTCNGGSPLAAKEASVALLQSILPTGNASVDKKIEKAIESIEDSLNPAWWVDDSTLHPKDGKKVFDEERHAVKELTKKQTEGIPEAQAVVAALVAADEALAQKAIDDATTAGGSAKDLLKAAKAMADAADYLADGKPEKAIEKYRKAWQYAQKSL